MHQTVTFYHFLLALLYWSSVVMLLIGLCIMLFPKRMVRLSLKLNHWISTEKFFNRLDEKRHGERFFYRHHVIFGIFLVTAAVYVFYAFMFSFDPEKFSLSLFASRAANQWLLQSLVFINLVFSVLIFLIGVIVVIRPSLLKSFEAAANRWIVVDQSLKKLDVQMKMPDTMFTRRPRFMGFLIVIGSIYILINLSSVLVRN